MKKIIFLFVFFSMCISTLKAQVAPVENNAAGPVYTVVDELATFPGGPKRMNEYFDLKYDPNAELQSKINDGAKEGFVEAKFIIELDGKVKVVQILQSYTPAYDEEMVKTLQSMPKWEAAKLKGKPVRSFQTYKYGISFVNNGMTSGGRKGHKVE